jgi:hypothetical protein
MYLARRWSCIFVNKLRNFKVQENKDGVELSGTH